MGYYGAPFYDLFFLDSIMLNITLPTFSGLPKAKAKVIDVYDNLSTSVQNNLPSKISAFDTDLDSIISGSLGAVKKVGSAIRNNGLDLPSAMRRVQDALGGSRSAISSISEMLEREILGDMTGTDAGTGYVRGASQMIDSVKMVFDGYTRTFGQNGYSNVTGVVDFIRELSGNQLIEVFDLGAQAALMTGVLSEISAWGLPELIDTTIGAKWNDQYGRYDYEYNDEFRFSVVKRASDLISPTTSLDVIEKLIIHGGAKALIAENPSFPLQLLNGYILPEGCVAGGPYPVMIKDPDDPSGNTEIPDPSGAQLKSNYFDQGRRLKNILNTLKPDWFYVERTVSTGSLETPFEKEVVWDLQYLNTASEPAQLVLANDTDVCRGLMAAPFYKIESGIQLLKNMYPYMVT